MHAYLLKTDQRTIEHVEWSRKAEGPGANELKRYYKLLDCSTITALRSDLMAGDDVIYVDDEGLIKGPVYQFFGVKGYPQPLAGRGLVLGTDKQGNSIAPETTREWLHQNVFWIERLTRDIWGIAPAVSPTKVKTMSLNAIEAMLAEDRPQPESQSG